MIVVIAFIINLFAPIVNVVGALGLIGCIIYQDFHLLPAAVTFAIIGFMFGLFAHRNDMPPRWSWAKSKNELFRFSVVAVLGYAWNFAAWIFAIYLVRFILEKIGYYPV